MDPFTIGLAFKAMQAAYEGISYCCEALSEGKVQVQKIKKAVDDGKAIVNDARSIWSTIKSLFGGSKPAAAAVAVASEPVAKKKAKEVYTTHIPSESEIVQQFVEHLGAFFRNQRAVLEYVEKRYEEVFASENPDPEAILELSVYKAQTDQAYVQLSGMMRGANVPRQLGPLWDNYNEIYSKVDAEQQVRKEQKRIKRQQDKWQREQEHNDRVEVSTALLTTLLLVAWLWALWINSFSEAF